VSPIAIDSPCGHTELAYNRRERCESRMLLVVFRELLFRFPSILSLLTNPQKSPQSSSDILAYYSRPLQADPRPPLPRLLNPTSSIFPLSFPLSTRDELALHPRPAAIHVPPIRPHLARETLYFPLDFPPRLNFSSPWSNQCEFGCFR